MAKFDKAYSFREYQDKQDLKHGLRYLAEHHNSPIRMGYKGNRIVELEQQDTNVIRLKVSPAVVKPPALPFGKITKPEDMPEVHPVQYVKPEPKPAEVKRASILPAKKSADWIDPEAIEYWSKNSLDDLETQRREQLSEVNDNTLKAYQDFVKACLGTSATYDSSVPVGKLDYAFTDAVRGLIWSDDVNKLFYQKYGEWFPFVVS